MRCRKIMNISPRCWGQGQLYVSLSRARSIEKVYFAEPILKEYLITDPMVGNFEEEKSAQ